MRSAAVLLSCKRCDVRRRVRVLVRTRVRQPRHDACRNAGDPVRAPRPARQRQTSRTARRRLRAVYAMPRGFVPLVRH